MSIATSQIQKYGNMVLRLMQSGRSLKDAVNDVGTTYHVDLDKLYVYVEYHTSTEKGE